jgi:hypothetical protein
MNCQPVIINYQYYKASLNHSITFCP